MNTITITTQFDGTLNRGRTRGAFQRHGVALGVKVVYGEFEHIGHTTIITGTPEAIRALMGKEFDPAFVEDMIADAMNTNTAKAGE